MYNLTKWSVTVAGLLLLAACTPSTSIKQPLTARPVERKAAPLENGSIFQAGSNERPLFEDQRPRNVGDVLIIRIAETTTASEKSSSNMNSSGNINVVTPTVNGGVLPHIVGEPVGQFSIVGGSSLSNASKSDNAGNNTFSGTITVTVVEVLPNGNLMVSGEKQVSIRQTQKYVRFSGVVNPNTITSGNFVQSTQVADVRVEYKGATNIDLSAVTSMIGNFFLSIFPF
jgi:flagellar L-ring protein precursor FlgH